LIDITVVSVLTTRVRKHRAVNKNNDKHRDGHEYQRFHTPDGRAAAGAFDEGEKRTV
jgi:hypothetical protein